MCTLIVLNECVAGYPLIVAANRDERYERRSRPPRLENNVICPLDEEAGGTWIGVGQDGWFVGITNQEDGRHLDDTLSRGSVVRDCLVAGNHCASAQALKALDLSRYNPFNIVFGRPGAMFLVRVMQGKELEMEPLLQGINVITNDCWGNLYSMKQRWARTLVIDMLVDPPDNIDEIITDLRMVMSDHHGIQETGDPFQSMCVHSEDSKFGTKSTSIITVSNEKDVGYWYSDGHQCQLGPFECVGTMHHSVVDEGT